MKKGTFVNYQLAEAILLLYDFIAEKRSMDEYRIELNKLKQKWKGDKIPATGALIPDLFSMQEITVDQLLKLSKELVEYDTYTIENAAGMQKITKINADGTFEFDFSGLDYIVKLARKNGKKIIIDSAIVHGDHFPEHFRKLSKEQLRNCIKSYIIKLVTIYGDDIERIDVLNSIFERKDVKSTDGVAVEDFWIEKFGENYGEEIINICKEVAILYGKDIPLCWNEFYITNVYCIERKNRFLKTVSRIDNLDIIGIQDAFQDTSDTDYIISVLQEIEDICVLTNKKYSVTELSCIICGETLKDLYAKLDKNPPEPELVEEAVADIEKRIDSIVDVVTQHSSNSDCCASIEGRISKELDYYSHRPELRSFNARTNTLINTIGNGLKRIVKEQGQTIKN